MEETSKSELTAEPKKTKPWHYVLKAIIILLAGYFAFNDGAYSIGLNSIILCFFGFCLLIYMLVRVLLTKEKETRRKNKSKLVFASLIWLALLAGLIIGKQQFERNINYTKKQAEPIILALENYFKTKGEYPQTLGELGIPIPKPLIGESFYYRSDKQNGKPYCSLSFQVGPFVSYFWSSDHEHNVWTIMD